MDSQKKIKLAKAKLAKKQSQNKGEIKKQIQSNEDLKAFTEGVLSKLIELQLGNQEASKQLLQAINAIDSSKDLKAVKTALDALNGEIKSGISVKNIEKAKAELRVVKSEPKIVTQKIELPKGLATDETARKAVSVLEQIEEKLKPSQQPANFTPMRRVVKLGDKFIFDDNLTGMGSSGGGGGSSSGSAGLTDEELRAAAVVVKDEIYTTRIDEASATVTYIGTALPGTLTSAASWLIKKIDSSSGTSITFADGNDNFDNIWDDRASLSYS